MNQAFPPKETKEEMVLNIIDVLKSIQKRFIIRSDTQERWEIKELEWMKQNKNQILSDLRVLGFVDNILPKKKSVDAVCILGATAPKMADRIEYANFLIQSGLKTKMIILLAGERYVTKDIDRTEDQLIEIANEYNLKDWRKLTETQLIEDLYKKSSLNNMHIAVQVIDTPRGNLPRPTTQTTILRLIEWLKNHKEIQNIIFVSNQPYVLYQRAIIDLIFKEQNLNNIKYEIVGSAVRDVNNLQSIIESMGSYMWAATPTVLLDMDVRITNEVSKNALKELYFKNPLIYNVIQQTFNSDSQCIKGGYKDL